MGDLHIAIYIA